MLIPEDHEQFLTIVANIVSSEKNRRLFVLLILFFVSTRSALKIRQIMHEKPQNEQVSKHSHIAESPCALRAVIGKRRRRKSLMRRAAMEPSTETVTP